MSSKGLHAALLISGIALLSGCARPATIVPVSDAELHGLMTQQISALYSQIEVLAFEQHPTQLELDAQRRQKSTEIATAAADLQQAAQAILTLQPRFGLNDTNGARFNELAWRLVSDAATLQSLAEQQQLANLGDAVQRTLGTCATCHQLYRRP